MGKAIALSKPVLIAGLLFGVGVILIIGLSSGLAARPRNCKKSETTATPPTTSTTRTPSSSSSSSSSSVSSSSTTRTTTTTPTTITTSTTTTTVTRTTPGFTNATAPPTTSAPVIGDVMLPKSYELEYYSLTIMAYFVPAVAEGTNTQSEEYFKGTVKIKFRLTVASNSITLHVHETMNLTSVKLHERNNEINVFPLINQQRLPYQKYQLTFSSILPVGEYDLEISYNGDYDFKRGSLAGFYLSKYREDGLLKTVGATQFEPTDARRAFPCFDEPSLKAAFDITIQHPVGTKALSNWPEVITINGIDESGKQVKITNFKETAKMSTYLVAWAIFPDDYGHEDSTSAQGTPIRIFSRKSAVQNNQLKFAAEAAKKALDYFQNVYFQINEAVPPKIDMITIPQFSFGAMENWGLVTYRETALLYSDTANSLFNKQSVASIISHELAHFWFGNLVTCSWWDDLWLNEAMASFLEVKAVDAIYPEFGMIDQFITSAQIPVMYDDGFYSTHPVYTNVVLPEQINSIFDSITYDKGNALLRMLESTVTPANFQAGLKAYITQNKFGSGKAEDFYNELTAPSDMNGATVKQYMDNWLNSVTYPKVDVFLDNSGAASQVKFYQSRFYFNEFDQEIDDGPEPNEDFVWKVYLRCRAGGTLGGLSTNPDLEGEILEFSFFLDDFTGVKSLPALRKYTWVKCNNDFKGFYVVEYEEPMIEKLSDILLKDPQVFTPADQADLLHSVWTLAYAEYTSYSYVAKLSNFLAANDISYVPWRAFSYHVSKIATILEHRPAYYGLSKYAIELIKEGIQQWPDQNIWNDQGDHWLRLSKINAADTLGRMQDYSVLVKASELFNTIPVSYFSSPNNVTNPLSPNLRSIVYKYHIQNTYDYFDWYKMVELYEMTSDPQERSAALLSLTFVRSTPTLAELLSNTMNGFVSGQDLFTVLANIGRNPTGRGNAWNFLRSNWNFFYERYGSGRGSGQAVRSICESFDNFFLAQSVREFYFDKPVGADRNLRVQTLYIVEWNQFWVFFKEKEIIANLFGPRK